MMTNADADAMSVSEELRTDHIGKGFPYCDTCGNPAVFNEMFGMRHVTDLYPFGVPEHADTSGHDVTFRKWYTES